MGTVSRVLNNSQQVSTETREKVLAAIAKLGFRPNRIAQRLSRGTRVQNIGVILPFITSPSFVERLRGVQMALSEDDNEYELILYNVSSPERYQAQLATIAQQRLVEGLLVISLDVSQEHREMLTQAGIAFVGVRGLGSNSWPCVGPDNVAGGKLATEYLLSLGHTRIAYVGDDFPDEYSFPTSQDRFTGYASALEEHGIEVNLDYVRLGRYGRDEAKRLTAELLELADPPTAIFAMSDVQALGCISAIREAGLRVPEDVSVIGFDDIEISYYVGLTTVRQHLVESGRLGMRYLLQLLREDGGDVPRLPPLEVIERQTTAPPPG